VAAVLASMTAMTLSAVPADAAVGGGRVIEVQTGSNLVILDHYPANADVLVEVERQGFVIGSTTKQTDADGLLELNHTGVIDCFDGPSSPDIRPGDVLRATLPNGTEDTSRVRGVWIDDVQFGVPSANSITVSGRVSLGGPTRVVPNTDVLELRINKDSAWAGTGRIDKREDIGGSVNPNGTWSHVMTAANAADVAEARNSSEVFLEWSGGGEAEASEITVAEPEGPPEEPLDCPPLQKGPTAPTLAGAQDSGKKGDHVTNQSAGLTFRGLAGTDSQENDVEPGPGAQVQLMVNGNPRGTTTANGNGVYAFAGVTLAPRARAYSVMVRSRDAADSAPFDSAVRRVKVDTRVPNVVLRSARPNPLHLAGPERMRVAYRVGEAAKLKAVIMKRNRTVKSFAVQNLRRAGRADYSWNGKSARRDVRPGRYRMLLTVTDTAGNQATHRMGFRVAR
jgi:hypothetical protein